MSQPNILYNFKSKNFDTRKKEIQFIILHYTETETLKKALELLTSNKRKVSSHFLVDVNGDIYNLVPLSMRAWHAGESSWRGFEDINSRSIGIEIVNSGEKKEKKYPEIQISSLIKLIIYLKKKFRIHPYDILGHSDIAPLRKIDPGKHFPWKRLSKNKIGMWINEEKKDDESLDQCNLKVLIKNIEKIGYSGLEHSRDCSENNKIIEAFHRHFLPNLVGKKPTINSLNKSFELLKLNKS